MLPGDDMSDIADVVACAIRVTYLVSVRTSLSTFDMRFVSWNGNAPTLRS
jgi:hypothetical protein